PDPADGLSALQPDTTDRRGLGGGLPLGARQRPGESVLVSAVQQQLPLPPPPGGPLPNFFYSPTLSRAAAAPRTVPLGQHRLRSSVRGTGNGPGARVTACGSDAGLVVCRACSMILKTNETGTIANRGWDL